MSRKFLFFVGVLVVSSSVVFATEARKVITGIVEHSFDPAHRFVRDAERVYDLETGRLGNETNAILEKKVGTAISISVPAQAITREWRTSFDAGKNSVDSQASPVELVKEEGSITTLQGRRLPSYDDSRAFIQVRHTIFEVDPASLSSHQRQAYGAILVRVPKSMIRSSWTVLSSEGSRMPAATGDRDEYDSYASGYAVSGVVQYTPLDSRLLVKGGNRFFLIHAANVSNGDVMRSEIGKRVSLTFPKSALIMSWGDE